MSGTDKGLGRTKRERVSGELLSTPGRKTSLPGDNRAGTHR